MISVSVRSRPYSQFRPAYMMAKKEFSQSPIGLSVANHEMFWEEFGKYIGASVIIERWVDKFPKVTALEFNTEADYAWFMLRYS